MGEVSLFPYSTYLLWPDKSARARGVSIHVYCLLERDTIMQTRCATGSSGNNCAAIFPARSVSQEEGGCCSSLQTSYWMLSCGNSLGVPFLPSLHTVLPPSEGDKSPFPTMGPLLPYFLAHRSAFCLLCLLEKRMGAILPATSAAHWPQTCCFSAFSFALVCLAYVHQI